ncbi:hypothetical protein [Terrabacter terrigena]|uniref:Uncharacterized protein n=1 Tax=Terrabacter terrigena TaxID=574718 RepID=A0ABW3N3Q8_9MICO
MRLRDQNKGDLALTGLTLIVAAAAAVDGASRWVARRHGRGKGPARVRPAKPHQVVGFQGSRSGKRS